MSSTRSQPLPQRQQQQSPADETLAIWIVDSEDKPQTQPAPAQTTAAGASGGPELLRGGESAFDRLADVLVAMRHDSRQQQKCLEEMLRSTRQHEEEMQRSSHEHQKEQMAALRELIASFGTRMGSIESRLERLERGRYPPADRSRVPATGASKSAGGEQVDRKGRELTAATGHESRAKQLAKPVKPGGTDNLTSASAARLEALAPNPAASAPHQKQPQTATVQPPTLPPDWLQGLGLVAQPRAEAAARRSGVEVA